MDFGTSNWNQPTFGSSGNFNTTGWLAGGTVGANYEFWGGAVLGVEGDWDWTNLSGTSGAGPCTGAVARWARGHRLPNQQQLAEHGARPRRLGV